MAAKDAPPPPPKPSIIDVLAGATAEDLETVRQRIGVLERELDGLAAFEKVLDVRLNGRPQKASAAKKAATPQQHTDLAGKRRAVVLYLKANGAKPKAKVAEGTRISLYGPGALSQVVDCDWFHVSPEGVVSLTDKGDRAVVV